MNSKARLPNNSIVKQYVILDQLGKGGFGVTYKVVDTNSGQVYAMKEYFPTDLCERKSNGQIASSSQEYQQFFEFGLKRFRNEAEILIGINHRNIVKAKEYFNLNGTAYFIMSYLNGEDLQSYLKQNGQLSQEEAFSIVMPILEALKTVHSYKIIHRDIKPANIFMLKQDSSYNPILIDFGAVKVFDSEMVREKSIYAVFSEGYAPPEQYILASEINYYTDIYAIGAILYEMITGEKLKPSQERVASENIENLSPSLYRSYNKEFLLATEMAIELKIANRPQTVEEFQKYLTGVTPVPKERSIYNKISSIKKFVTPQLPNSDSVMVNIMENRKVWSKNKILVSLFVFIFVASLVLLTNGNVETVIFLVLSALILGGIIYTNSTQKTYRLIPNHNQLPIIEINLNEEIKVGRGSHCDIRLDGIASIDTSYISNTHLQLYASYGGLYVKDIGTDGSGSRNGTYINSQKLSPSSRVKIEVGDELFIANSDVCYRLESK